MIARCIPPLIKPALASVALFIAATPILLAYPLLRKHFVVGVNPGSIKE